MQNKIMQQAPPHVTRNVAKNTIGLVFWIPAPEIDKPVTTRHIKQAELEYDYSVGTVGI